LEIGTGGASGAIISTLDNRLLHSKNLVKGELESPLSKDVGRKGYGERNRHVNQDADPCHGLCFSGP